MDQKLENDFPEIIHGLMDIIFPHYLRPVPSTSIVMFFPKPSLKESITVKKNTSLASIPVEGEFHVFIDDKGRALKAHVSVCQRVIRVKG